MASYLLLRSNKETGPYNLEDLINIGLKPYDLVWVQGKSAAWRYPSEVEELKPYAPVAEEQPYDRFYKKNNQQELKEVQVVVTETVTPVVTKEAPIEEKYSKYIPRKSVFVTMPGQSMAASAAGTASQKQAVADKKPVPVPEQTITVTENPAAAQIKYSQPLDEIKEMYVKTLQDRKSKIARRNLLMSGLKKVAVIAGLVLSGLLAGYLLKSRSDTKSVSANQPVQSVQQPPKTQPVSSDPVVPSPVTTQTGSAITNHVETPSEPVTTTTNPQPDIAVTEKSTMPAAIRNRLMMEEKRQYAESKLKNKPATAPASQSSTQPLTRESFHQQAPPVKSIGNDPVTGERTRQVRTESGSISLPTINSNANTPSQSDAKAVMKSKRNSLDKLVAVTSNDYKRVAFGGIRNLELTVTNDSKYMLDKVTVELTYIKPNELPLRTETIFFHTISAGGASTIRIPDTNRGIKVTYKIVDIQSAQQETASTGF